MVTRPAHAKSTSHATRHTYHVAEVEAERDGAVTAVVVEAVAAEHEGAERHVRRVHGLEREAGLLTVEVGITHEITDRLNDLLEKVALDETSLKHDG